jgi:hypothetical protein
MTISGNTRNIYVVHKHWFDRLLYSEMVTTCIPLIVSRRFGGICSFYLPGRIKSQAGNLHEAGNKLCAPVQKHLWHIYQKDLKVYGVILSPLWDAGGGEGSSNLACNYLLGLEPYENET